MRLTKNFRTSCGLAIGICYALVICRPLYAQNLQPLTTVHAAGEHSVTLAPQKLRVTITMHAEGTDAKSAVRSLAEHKARVKQDLAKLKADESSIKFGATQVGGVMSGAMPRAVVLSDSSAFAPPTFALPVAANNAKLFRAAATVTADWPLPTTDLDALALLPEALRAQMEAHDLRGEKNKAELSPEEQERREEMQLQIPVQYSDYEANQQVAVYFVAKIAPPARQDAMKAAYEKAVTDADMLAVAAGRKRGELVRIQRMELTAEPFVAHPAPAVRYSAPIFVQSSNSPTRYAADEVTASTPDGLKYSVLINADFGLIK